MARRQTHLDKAIANIDEKIRALQLAKEHLEQEREAKKATTKRTGRKQLAAAANTE
jgi:hypothetical protein